MELDLSLLEEFTPQQTEIMEICLKEFYSLNPSQVLHPKGKFHHEGDLLSHVKLAVSALKKTDRYQTSSDRFRLVLSVLLHDVGKALQWKQIDTSSGHWHFKGHDTVGACWFWKLVQTEGWDQEYLYPVFLSIWFHMVRSPFNAGLLGFLGEALPFLETLHCSDDCGRLEVQSQLPEIIPVPTLAPMPALPDLPLVVYICGESGAGKTTFSHSLIQKNKDLKTGYVSFDRALLEVGGITQEWADMDSQIRTGIYKKLYADPQIRKSAEKLFEQHFTRSLENNRVTLLTTTVMKPTFRTLPFGSVPSLKVVTSLDRNNMFFKVFGGLRYAMEATRNGAGWASDGPLLYLPEKELVPAIRHLLSAQRFKLNPPQVYNLADLMTLIQYWVKLTGSVEGMILAFSTYYDIQVIAFECEIGKYYNFFYNDGAPYDDPFDFGGPSPATFCRGTTFHLSPEGHWSLVRLPMNRGREIRTIEDAEDSDKSAKFYSNLAQKIQEGPQQWTAKVDGSLLILFRDEFGIKENLLPNSSKLVLGTKGSIIPTKETSISMLQAIEYSGVSFEEFIIKSSDYMEENKLTSLSFEMVSEKLSTLVVDYPKNLRGLYFLGGSGGETFQPYFDLPKMFIPGPETKAISLKEASALTLGPFPEHIEGSVIWAKDGDHYYPLKLKTLLYYLLHRSRKDCREEYIDYLKSLIDEYGWLGSPKYGSLKNKYLILTLFGMVNLPEQIIEMIPALRESRKAYLKLSEIQGTHQEVKSQLSPVEFTQWCRFKSVYGTHRYDQAYELI